MAKTISLTGKPGIGLPKSELIAQTLEHEIRSGRSLAVINWPVKTSLSGAFPSAEIRFERAWSSLRVRG